MRPTLAALLARAERDASGCLLWTGAVDDDGYGRVGWREHGASHGDRVHRLVDELVNGPREDGLCVLHHCDTPGCLDVKHLFRGDRLVNNRDKVSKGRQRQGGVRMVGMSNPNARLTDEQVESIRVSREPQRVVAARYGINQATVSRIKSGEHRAAPTRAREVLYASAS